MVGITPTKSRGIRATGGELLFEVLNNIFMGLFVLLMVYPFWHILMYSLSDVDLASRGGIFLWPRGFSSDTYRVVLRNRVVLSGFRVSSIVTVAGTAAATMLTALTAYPLSKKRLRGRTAATLMVFFTMLFNGGLVPNYLLVKGLGLIDTYAALILPGMLSAWNIFIMRNFFANIPDSLEESGRMDGANDFVIFIKILLPISKPVLATIALFYAVGYWNNYFSTVVYINSRDKWALQAVLRDIVSSASQAMERQGVTITELKSMTPQTVTMATVVVATVPILVVYPFIQKYFIQGIMVGSLKG